MPKVLIAYDDLASAAHALRLVRRAFANAGQRGGLEALLWSFALLEQSGFGELASADAAQADILLIASRAESPFSPPITQWIAECIRNKLGQYPVLVSLLEISSRTRPTPSEKSDFLRSAAEKAGIDFLASETLVDLQTLTTLPGIGPPIHSVSLPDRFWGLNE